MTNIPTQGRETIGINILEQDANKVKSSSEKGKVVEGEELLSQLIFTPWKKHLQKPLCESWQVAKGFEIM